MRVGTFIWAKVAQHGEAFVRAARVLFLYTIFLIYVSSLSPSLARAGRRSKTVRREYRLFRTRSRRTRSPASLSARKTGLSFVRTTVGRELNFTHNVKLTFFFLVLGRPYSFWRRVVGFTWRRTVGNCTLQASVFLGESKGEKMRYIFRLPVSSYLI